MNAWIELSDYLAANDLRLSTAESCTAGLIASMLGDVDGCGQWLECGFVTYSPPAKQRVLGVAPELIEQYGLTSEEVAREMAKGALARSRADIAIANTGVAGPADAPDGTKAGTVCLAWAVKTGERMDVLVQTKIFSGDRHSVRSAAAQYAISTLLTLLKDKRRSLLEGD